MKVSDFVANLEIENEKLKQKITDMEVEHMTKMIELELKYRNELDRVKLSAKAEIIKATHRF